MLSVQGESNESLVLDGDWFEKQRGGEPKARLAASSFRSVEWKEFEKRTKLFGGEKVAMVQVTLTFETPPFVGFVTEAGNRPALEEIVSDLEAARG
ncbi:MAG TPA: hypothetical protein VJL81_11585 [Solirubrobacterales bacterium]|nr:hypothetical protein [Solirubrobacterales bacterium]